MQDPMVQDQKGTRKQQRESKEVNLVIHLTLMWIELVIVR